MNSTRLCSFSAANSIIHTQKLICCEQPNVVLVLIDFSRCVVRQRPPTCLFFDEEVFSSMCKHSTCQTMCTHQCQNLKRSQKFVVIFFDKHDTHRRTYTRTRDARKRRKACYQAELASFFCFFFFHSPRVFFLSSYHVICRQRKRVPYVCVSICIRQRKKIRESEVEESGW